MKYTMALEYTIPFGDLTPYFDALAQGDAMASTCQSCGSVAFPARMVCGACARSDMSWTKLNGHGRVLWRTDGTSGSFALIAFEGADTSSTVAISNPEQTGRNGKLIAPQTDRPGLWFALTDDTDTKEGKE